MCFNFITHAKLKNRKLTMGSKNLIENKKFLKGVFQTKLNDKLWYQNVKVFFINSVKKWYNVNGDFDGKRNI